jgi:hypothetical protein
MTSATHSYEVRPRKKRRVDLTYTLEVLWCGLCHLNRIVSKLEEARRQNDPKANDLLAVSFDSDCESGDPTLLKYFFWYSCSADSFLALFSTTFATEKDSRAFRNMRKFRDKVAAHPCDLQSDPRRGDSEAARSASLRQFVTWNFGRYSVGREITTDSQGKESSPSDWGWELTKTHEKLDTFVREKLSQALETGTRRNRTSPARLLATVVSATVEPSRN